MPWIPAIIAQADTCDLCPKRLPEPSGAGIYVWQSFGRPNVLACFRCAMKHYYDGRPKTMTLP